MQFINIIISLAALGAVASAQVGKRSCVGSKSMREKNGI
jgi:hypothetical protein